jgi:hypothetical protein
LYDVDDYAGGDDDVDEEGAIDEDTGDGVFHGLRP